MTQYIEDKVVVITGGSSGLGAETARHLAKAGAEVVLGARRTDRLNALADELGLRREAVVKTDVTDREQVKALVDRAAEIHGRVDVMLNNAGLMPLSPLEMERFDEWEQAIDVNIKGVLWGIAAALRPSSPPARSTPSCPPRSKPKASLAQSRTTTSSTPSPPTASPAACSSP